MQKLYKRLVSLMIAIFVISSIPIIASASEAVTSGSVNNSYRHYLEGDVDYSYTWKYYDNDTLVILPSSYYLYINVNDLSDYMKTRFTSNTKITIDCSLNNALMILGDDCPASDLTFVGDDLSGFGLFDFHELKSVNIDINFAPSEYGHLVDAYLYNCGITTLDIFEGEGYTLNVELRHADKLTSIDVPEYVDYLYVFSGVLIETIKANYDLKYLYAYYLNSLKSVYVYGDITWNLSIFDSPNLDIFEVTGDVGTISLTDVNLSHVTVPGNSKFFISSDSLTSATVESGRTYMCGGMFDGCINLKDVNIPDGVTEIYGSAFRNCSSLNSIVIPSSVNFICDDAFDGCTSLTDVYFQGSSEQWESIEIHSGEH